MVMQRTSDKDQKGNTNSIVKSEVWGGGGSYWHQVTTFEVLVQRLPDAPGGLSSPSLSLLPFLLLV